MSPDEAVVVLKSIRDALPRDHPDRPMYLSTLGGVLFYRFGHTGRAEDLEESIAACREAAGSAEEEDPERPAYISNLAGILRTRFERFGRQEDLEEMTEVARQAVASASEEHPDRPMCLSNLSACLRLQYERHGRREDLDEATEVARQAAGSASEEHPDRLMYLSNFGRNLSRRFEVYGQVADLSEAIGLFRQLAGSVTEDDPGRPEYLSYLGRTLSHRYELSGQGEDLEEAIEVTRVAAGSASEGDSGWSGYMANLGRALLRRFELYGGGEDLEEAIEVARRAADFTPEEHPDKPRILANLATALQVRFGRYGRGEDLEEAIDVARSASASTPEGYPGRPMYLSLLGEVLFRRFEQTGQADELEEAIAACRQAAASAPEEHPERSAYLSNLGTVLLRRFELYGNTEDLDEAVRAGRRAARSAAEDDPTRPRILSNLGAALRTRSERQGRGEDLVEAVTMFRTAARLVAAPVLDRVQAAREWGRLTVLAGHSSEAVEGYAAAVDLMGLVASQELGRPDQEFRLGDVSGLGSEAAAACVQAGQVGRAVELFEQGRAVLFSRVLDSRSDLTDLQRAYPDLAERFVRWRDVLDRPDLSPSGLGTEGDAGNAAARMARDRRREAAVGLEEVLAEIRKCVGFEGFLLPRPVEELLPAAAEGPVVLLNVASLRSDALILSEGDVEVLPLEEASPEEVGRQLTAFLAALDEGSESALAGVLAWLGERVTGPVLDHLGYTTTPSAGMPWPRVWWCPSGALSLLPLHAAGRHEVSDGPPNAVIDRVISSTVPTVRALLRARQAPPPESEPRMLVVAMPATPGQTDLPGVVQEADTLQKLYPERVDVLGLPGTDPADYDNVMAALPGHPMVHFACHGESDLSDPSASHLLLNDYQTRPLTVLELTGARLQGSEMAFLSACTTARTGAALPDEPIHLAAACQLAGYRQVIASLWPIGDDDTAALTKDFYTTLTNTPRDTNAAAALHQATRRLRLIYRDRPSHWAPYTHTGP